MSDADMIRGLICSLPWGFGMYHQQKGNLPAVVFWVGAAFWIAAKAKGVL
jgi:hypothetical protein